MRLIHITDPHLTSLEGIPSRHFVGKRRLGHASWRFRRRFRHLRATLDELSALAVSMRPDLIVVTGDLVHLGLAAEIEAAASWLRTLGTPEQVLVVPGNHDLYGQDSWAAVLEHWRDYLRLGPTGNGEPGYWAGFPSHVELEGIEIHGLNTGLPTPIFMATGELGGGQCERLGEALNRAPADSLHIMAIHHPPGPGAVPGRKALKDMGRLASLAAQTDLVLHGHGHFNRSYRLKGIPVFATGSASKPDAPFRCFDIARENGAWQGEMRLYRRGPEGFLVAETQALEFLRP